MKFEKMWPGSFLSIPVSLDTTQGTDFIVTLTQDLNAEKRFCKLSPIAVQRIKAALDKHVMWVAAPAHDKYLAPEVASKGPEDTDGVDIWSLDTIALAFTFLAAKLFFTTIPSGPGDVFGTVSFVVQLRPDQLGIWPPYCIGAFCYMRFGERYSA